MGNTEAQAIVELAKPVTELVRGGLYAINNDYELQDLEEFQEGRNRSRGTLLTPSFDDFKSYVSDASESGPSPVFVNHKSITAVAILNYAQADFVQGHCDHKAILQLEQTVAWAKLNQLKDNKLNQKRFATLLEDWASVFAATNESGESIHIAEAINAVRNMKVDATATKDSVVNNMKESRSVFEQVEATSTAGKLPSYFEIIDTAYVGLDEKTIKLRLLVNSSDGEPTFALQIVKEELLCNEIVQEFKEKVIALLPENPVRIGTFDAK